MLRFRQNPAFFSFDPQFGYTGTGTIAFGLSEDGLGSSFVVPSSGTVDNISVYFRERSGPATLSCSIYLNSTKAKLTNGDTVNVSIAVADEGDYSWH